MLVAVYLLNKTTGRAANPIREEIFRRWPSADSLAQGESMVDWGSTESHHQRVYPIWQSCYIRLDFSIKGQTPSFGFRSNTYNLVGQSGRRVHHYLHQWT